jgi:hypothetical protein
MLPLFQNMCERIEGIESILKDDKIFFKIQQKHAKSTNEKKRELDFTLWGWVVKDIPFFPAPRVNRLCIFIVGKFCLPLFA